MPRWDSLWVGANLATMTAGGEPYGALADGALGVADGRIAWLGPAADLPGAPARCADRVIDAGGQWITPGLIDCHTHAVFGGDRAGEFELRLGGARHADIAAAGGGILSTVTATRRAAEEDLVEAAAKRLSRLEGVTTVEIKSGYGLDGETEHKMLRAARALGTRLPLSVVTSYLGAHTVPPEYAGRREDYLAIVCEEVLPAVAYAGLADAVDAFCEGIAFTPAETSAVFEAARALGLAVKLHADQLSDSGGAALAAGFGALSADHLEHASEEGIKALATAGTVAVLLPGAYYTLGGGKATAGRVAAHARRGDGGSQRLQPRLLARVIALVDAQHGVHALSPDPRRGAGRGHPQRGIGARARHRPRHLGCGQACRSRAVGHRPPRRAGLLDRRQPVRRCGQGWRAGVRLDQIHGQFELRSPKVPPAAKRSKPKGVSSATAEPLASMRATSLPTPVILKPWPESAIM